MTDTEQEQTYLPPVATAPTAPNGHEHEPLSPPAPLPVAEEAPDGPSVETLLWLALLVAAALLRFGDLGRWPLGEHEARLALAAWQESEGFPHISRGLSPLLLGANDLLFWLFREGDALARALPALLGTLSLGVVALWRPLLGRGGTLGAALLVALSPSLLFFSRQATAEMPSIFFALTLLAGLLRFGRWQRPGDAWLAAISLALGLASGPGFWSLLGAGALWLGWLRVESRRHPEGTAATAWATLTGHAATLPASRLVGGALATLIIAATGFGTNPAGLGAAFDLPAQWLTNLVATPPMILPFTLAVLFYELPIIILGILGAALWVEREPTWTTFLLLWAAVTIIPATLANSGWPGGVALVALPLALLGGVALARIGRALADAENLHAEMAFLGLALIVGGFLWLNLQTYIYTAETSRLWLALASGAVLISALTLAWSMNGTPAMLRALGAFAAILLVLTSLRTAWHLSFVRASDAREPLAAATLPSDPDIRNLPAFLRALSVDRLGQRDALAVAVQRSLGTAPHWYLRNFANLTIVEGSSPDLPEVALLDSMQPAPGPNAIGQRYALRPQWAWPGLRGQALVRWLITRNIREGLGAQDAILYVTVP